MTDTGRVLPSSSSPSASMAVADSEDIKVVNCFFFFSLFGGSGSGVFFSDGFGVVINVVSV